MINAPAHRPNAQQLALEKLQELQTRITEGDLRGGQLLLVERLLAVSLAATPYRIRLSRLLPVNINYGLEPKDLFQELLVQANLAQVDRDFNHQNFPIENPGVANNLLVLVSYPIEVELQEIMRMVELLGLFTPGPEHCLALASQHFTKLTGFDVLVPCRAYWSPKRHNLIPKLKIQCREKKLALSRERCVIDSETKVLALYPNQ